MPCAQQLSHNKHTAKKYGRVLEPFTNQARSDGLILHHWGRKKTAKPKTSAVEGTASEDNPQTEGEDAQEADKDYQFAKYNIQVEVPTYTDELYNAQLQDPDWTREETDYLVDTVRDFGQKWPVVVDRYEYSPPSTEDGLEAQAKTRTMEQLKHRYYTLSAKVLAHTTPISSMNTSQYALYSLLQSFNPAQEANRKRLAEGHLYRTPVEVDEETILLAELQRIMINQAQLEAERRDIRDRLEYPISTSNASGAQYSTSTALGALFQQLLQADRMKKDRKFKPMPEHNNATPASAQAGPGAAQSAAHRDSITSATGPARKPGGRDSLAGADRPLTAHAEQRYFITHHDRLSSGVSFASDKLIKPRLAKSAIQTERIATVLAHLQVPEVIPLPTQKVVEEFDRLMAKVGALLEMRKVAEKEEGEIRVKGAERGIKAEREGGSASIKEERRASLVTGDIAQTAGQKRSASVMSESVGQQGNKRPRN